MSERYTTPEQTANFVKHVQALLAGCAPVDESSYNGNHTATHELNIDDQRLENASQYLAKLGVENALGLQVGSYVETPKVAGKDEPIQSTYSAWLRAVMADSRVSIDVTLAEGWPLELRKQIEYAAPDGEYYGVSPSVPDDLKWITELANKEAEEELGLNRVTYDEAEAAIRVLQTLSQ